MAHKSTRREIHARIEQVVELRLGGAELAQVVHYANQNAWSVGTRMCQKYIAAADLRIAGQAEKDRARLIALHVARRMNVFRRAMDRDDLKVAMAVLKDLGQIQAIYPTQALRLKLEDATTPRTMSVLSKEDIQDLRNMALARLGHIPLTPGTFNHVDISPNGSSPPTGAAAGPVQPPAGPPPPAPGGADAPPAPGGTNVPTARGGANAPPVHSGQHPPPPGGEKSPPEPPPLKAPDLPLWQQPKRPRRALGGTPAPGCEHWLCTRCGSKWVRDSLGTTPFCPDCEAQP
jgi:hypothetical protein